MIELYYTPTEPPAIPFAAGDLVEVLDRNHVVISRQTVTKSSKRRVTTNCGRIWTQQGEWFDGQHAYPFPSIRRAPVAAPASSSDQKGGA